MMVLSTIGWAKPACCLPGALTQGWLLQVKEEGWLPQHVLIRHAETQQLHACVPLYLKGHSYGEYVFDNSWAHLAARVGQRYYVSSLRLSTMSYSLVCACISFTVPLVI